MAEEGRSRLGRAGTRQGTPRPSTAARVGSDRQERRTAERFLGVLSRFMHGRHRRVFVVLAGHPAHRAKVMALSVQRLSGHLERHVLPGDGPELHADEVVWNSRT